MILIIDNQSQYIHKFKRSYLDEKDIPYLFVDHNEAIKLDILPAVDGLILSGGKGNPYEPLNLTSNYVAMMNLDVPTIGFCLGHEIIAVGYQTKIRRLPEYHAKKELIQITQPEDAIFKGIDKKEILMQKKHRFHVATLPKDFEVLATSDTCSIEAMRHKDKPIYGFQGHPEVTAGDGMKIMDNFMDLCFSV